MILKSLSLQNFRNYTKSEFNFTPQTTIVVGPNAIGKTNLIDAVYALATGKSFKAENYIQLIKFGKKVCRLKGVVSESTSNTEVADELEVIISETTTQFVQKKFLVNGVSKRRIDFSGRMPVVLFTPLDLDIVAGQPGVRRRFLDEILEQIDPEYAIAHAAYIKAIRQRNALLEQARESGFRNDKLFLYWDDLLIKNGQIITKKRQELVDFINKRKKEIFEFTLVYDKSTISEDRLFQYKAAEMGAGVTLVGPHRDDVLIFSQTGISREQQVRHFGSRGQQRLVALELKLSQIAIIKERTENPPVLLLDDVFSELDSGNIAHVLDLMDIYQTIITTTHKEFIGKHGLKNMKVIELNNK